MDSHIVGDVDTGVHKKQLYQVSQNDKHSSKAAIKV